MIKNRRGPHQGRGTTRNIATSTQHVGIKCQKIIYKIL